MYDCSKELEKFYRKKVVLSAKEQNELREKRKLNIKRLKEGLSEYNSEKNKDYKIAEERIQGSMAMHTITQNDKQDYDIDVGIVFEEDNLNELGSLATRNMVANALERKTKQFAEDPEVKTSCVRLKYNSTGYHVDFAVFKRYKKNSNDEYIYEHSGSEWSVRHIKDLELWFSERIKDKGDDLRKVIRLSKMFCKSRESWKNMPSGLIQTVICEENFNESYSRLDERFYYTMKNIVNRLNSYLEVYAPVDNGRSLVNRDVDYQRMKNWKKRLETQLDSLNILFDDECTFEYAVKAWGIFFEHSYWNELSNTVKKQSFTDTEEFIGDLYPILEQFDVTIDCKVSGNGFISMPFQKYLERYAPRLKKFIPPNFKVECSIQSTNCPAYDKILWKVLNVGAEAEKRNDIRGQIQDRGSKITENTNFRGNHFIECYLIKDNVCVGIGHVDVPIGGI
ncbi:nucleotidyltransferase [Enterococcus faecalis]|uniref:nucleotidyltransferase n=1 Tax=Enterococcus faecalis TaxID=1351 RepID=UPI0024588162|nr:nucleotidyltransferase [Enterococcus faecalis]MDH5039306.1 nucleotidyltransferase [Enterococcus faecalis]